MQHLDIKKSIATGLGLLRRYREKQGVAELTELTAEERATYEQWEAILTKELTLDNLRDFLVKQQHTLSKELREAVEGGNERKALRIVARLDNYETLATFIEEPAKNREQLIKQLTSLTEN